MGVSERWVVDVVDGMMQVEVRLGWWVGVVMH